MYTQFIGKKGDGISLNFDEIEKGLEEINSIIFINSLHKNLNIEQLAGIYRRLLEFRERFLDIGFMGIEVDKLEQIRFLLMEEICMVRIFIEEKVGQVVIKDVKKLKHLYESNEKMGGIQIE